MSLSENKEQLFTAKLISYNENSYEAQETRLYALEKIRLSPERIIFQAAEGGRRTYLSR